VIIMQTCCLVCEIVVAWFGFDPSTTTHDVLFTNDDRTVTTCSFDDRVVLGSVGFTRGVHYWEMVVDRYENNKDPAFGVARLDVAIDKILGMSSVRLHLFCACERGVLNLKVCMCCLCVCFIVI